jgi:hypothetical protein
MVASKLDRYLGNGLYSISEAALYSRVSAGMLNRWLFGSKVGEAVIAPQFDESGKHVTFLDLVQTLAIREIRMQRRVPLGKFRQAIKEAKKRFDLDYPFARRHCTYLLGDELVIRPSPDQDDFIEASGRHRGQRLFPFVEMYLDDLSFGPDGLANKYQIYVYQPTAKRRIRITMDPRYRFGEPLLPSGHTPLTIWEAITAEGGIDRAARAYGIPKEEAEAAYQFVVNHLGKAA